MSEKKKASDDFMISFADLIAICKRGKSKIYFGIVLFSLFALLWTLTTPVEYIAEASFKDKGRAKGGLSSLSGLLFGANEDNDAITLLKSRAVGEELVRRLGLQARISRNTPQLPWVENIRDNLIVENALFKGSLSPSLEDITLPFEAKEVLYKTEVPRVLTITFLNEESYETYDGLKRLEGFLEQPLEGSDFILTLSRTKPDTLKGSYTLLLLPLTYEANNISKLVRVEPDRLDRTLLNIKYGHRDRHQAAKVVSALTEVYKDFLHKEQSRIIQAQVKYLEKRQDEIAVKLKEMMEGHIANLTDDMSIIGFANTTGAMEYLTALQNRMQEKLLDMEFEAKRLQKVQNDKQAYFDGYSLPGDPAIINHLLSEMRNLKQQGDWIDLALRKSPCLDETCTRKMFEEQIASLDNNRQSRREAKEVLTDLEQGLLPDPQLKLVSDSQYLVKVWNEKLLQIEASQGTESIDWENCCTQLSAYLNNLIHHFDVHEKAMEERLSHQQSEEKDFQGIDLNTARELYIGYSKQLNEMEAQILQHGFTIDQMERHDFEMSSLSTLMTDPVSAETVLKAARLALELKDQNNRSLKEQERIREELAVQKRFLSMHLKNAIQLIELKVGLVHNKIRSLQHVMLGLIQQQVSLLEKHLGDYIASRIKDLKQQSEVIEDHKKELRSQVAALPSKWISEMLIDQQIEVNKKTMEEVSRLVESKVIGNNIEIVQSTLIDPPVVPIHPKSPKLLFFAVLGAFMGAFLTVTFIITRELVSGLKVSAVNLKLQGQHVAGILSSSLDKVLQDQDLDTLRRLSAYLCGSKSESAQTLLLVSEKTDFAPELATLLTKQGLKVLLIPLSFDSVACSQGLLQYLEGNSKAPKVNKGEFFDSIAAGGISRYSTELLKQQRFTDLLNELSKEYDWIIGVSHASPTSGEVENLLQMFDVAAVKVHEERLDDLKACLQTEKKISFILNPTSPQS